MARNIHPSAERSRRQRASAPLPHPSWSRTEAVRAGEGRRLSSDEFWGRLGL